MIKLNTVEVFTDGACRGNPGVGGWGALLRYKNKEKTLYGSAANTTNNQMELTAAIKALESITRRCHVIVTTDSQYVKDGISKWIHGWQKNGWRTAAKKPVKNKELWQQLLALVVQHDVEWHWVRGHTGHPENELADQLANQAIDERIGNQ